MSVNFQAQAVIGCRVPVEELYGLTNERACAHPLPDSAAFCMACGKPAYKVVREALFDTSINMLVDLYVVFDTDKKNFIIGPITANAWAHENPKRTPITGSMDDLARQTRAVLEPLGLWNALEFGLWAVPYVSY